MVGAQIKKLRKQKKMSQTDLAKIFGVTQQAVGKWETDKCTPSAAILRDLARLFNTSVDYLVCGDESVYGMANIDDDGYAIPVLGTVKAGYNRLAFEDDLGTEYAKVSRPGDYFYLQVKGNSMEPYIRDGDLALVHRQAALESGDLGVVIYGDGEGTLKKFIQNSRDMILLQPFNPDYDTLVISGSDLENVYVAGKVIETKRKW